VLEAMGCGLPVVAAGAGGLAELVDDETGVLARPNCPDSLAEAIRHAAASDLAALGATARRKAESSFDWEAVFSQLLMHYCRLLPQDASGCATQGRALDEQSYAGAGSYQ
jgi:alpha-1,6-mannosyltransferase